MSKWTMSAKIIRVYYNVLNVIFPFVPYKINTIFKLLNDQIFNRYLNSLKNVFKRSLIN